MTTHKDNIISSLEYGTLAPSVHNQQPWQVKIEGNKVLVSLCIDRVPRESDPTHRESWISVGCFVENIVIAASHLGLACSDKLLNESVELEFKQSQMGPDEITLGAIADRRTNRNIYAKCDVKSNNKKLLSLINPPANVEVDVVDSVPSIQLTSKLLEKATAMALNIPGFKKEIGESLTPTWKKSQTGIPSKSLGLKRTRGLMQPLLYKFSNVAESEAAEEGKKLRSASGLMFVLTSGDVWRDWIMAGRSYQRGVLGLTQLGYAHATTAALVEAPDFHTEIEKELGTKYRLQAIVRFGKSNGQPKASPRLSVGQITQAT